MRALLVVAVVLAVAAVAEAKPMPPSFPPPPTSPLAVLLPGSGLRPAPTTTTLQPVVGSVQRTGRFTNPFTHKSKHTGTVYNPVLGQFTRTNFRR
ncbi:MAG: hypothetical protein K2V38_17905 [Gemmataceae bacterium]|nr:hypothetical protein [Gemmataceae bacterium]